MSVPMSQVLTTARTYLNDDGATMFPDPVLIPKVQEAHRELQEELWAIGSPIIRGQTNVLTYAGGGTNPTLVTNVNTPGWPPSDLLCPTAIFENAGGSLFAAPGWNPVTETYYMPLGVINPAVISYWMWQQEQLYVNATNVGNQRALVIQYRRQITIPVVATDLIGIQFGESYLAARAAAIAAGTVGNVQVMDSMTKAAQQNLSKVISANRGSQRPLFSPGSGVLTGIDK